MVRNRVEERRDDERDERDARAAGDERDVGEPRALGAELRAPCRHEARREEQHVERHAQQSEIDAGLEIRVVHGLERRAPHLVEREVVEPDAGADERMPLDELHRRQGVVPARLRRAGRIGVHVGDRAEPGAVA